MSQANAPQLPKFSYERVVDPDAPEGVHFRVRDQADNRLATCYLEENAFHISEALNYHHGLPVHWSCGHVSASFCAVCHQALIQRANQLQAEVNAGHSVIKRIILNVQHFIGTLR